PNQAGFMSRVWVPLKVIGPLNPGDVLPAAMVRLSVMSTLPVEWLFTMRRAPLSIQDVTSLFVVPFMAMLCSPFEPPVDGNHGLPPRVDMSNVRSRSPVIFDSTTAALMLLTFSSRRYLLSVATWSLPVPPMRLVSS